MSLSVLALLIYQVLGNGLGVYGDRGFDFLDTGLASLPARAGVAQGLIGSFWIAVCVVVLALPLGIGAAIYLEEYAAQNRMTSFIGLNIRNLAGVPSIVYGILGFTIFTKALRSRGVSIEVLQDPRCIDIMRAFIAAHPALWNEDIGV